MRNDETFAEPLLIKRRWAFFKMELNLRLARALPFFEPRSIEAQSSKLKAQS